MYPHPCVEVEAKGSEFVGGLGVTKIAKSNLPAAVSPEAKCAAQRGTLGYPTLYSISPMTRVGEPARLRLFAGPQACFRHEPRWASALRYPRSAIVLAKTLPRGTVRNLDRIMQRRIRPALCTQVCRDPEH